MTTNVYTDRFPRDRHPTQNTITDPLHHMRETGCATHDPEQVDEQSVMLE